MSYDMQQALAMRGQAAACAARGRRRPSASSPSSINSSATTPPPSGASSPASPSMADGAPTPTAEDANLALRGLDRAEELEQNGELREALKIYELSIEALIRYINASPSSPTKGSGSSY